MSQSFGLIYSDAYDLIYRDKDYNAECDLIERIFQTYSNSTRSVLDLGCGTGNHAFPLAQRPTI
jgi:ubiquinone/menaquinone biosynthesis C-methylase UbiE